jgi:hypothetical protein
VAGLGRSTQGKSLQYLDGSMRIGILLINRKMRFKTLKAEGRRLSESRMRENAYPR